MSIPCGRSTSALSTELRHFKKGNKTEFKIDLAIVRESRHGWERLIHRKTGFVAFDQWYWNEAPSSRGLTDKVRDIKQYYYLYSKRLLIKKQKQNKFNVDINPKCLFMNF